VTAGELSPYSSDEAASVTDVQGNTVSVERVINAPAAQIFALIADAGKHSSIDGSGTVDHSPDESQPLSLGSKFGMSMRGRPESLFLPYRTTNTVIEFEPDRRIAWKTTMGPLGLIGGRIWRYELSPADGGTLVRETWDVSQDRQRPMLKMGAMPKQAEDGMRATLERIAALVEP
jgi:uncharacterized protein YndB with AHSA1/START domain